MLRDLWNAPLTMRDDLLTQPMERLELALSAPVAGCERTWAGRVGQALNEVEQAVQQHAAAAEDTDSMFTQVDLTRPTLVRRIHELREEHAELLDQVSALRRGVARAADAFRPEDVGPLSMSALPATRVSGPVPNFSALRQQAQELLTALQHHRDAEGELVLESVNTDLGAGD
jgi:hypothetical protein